MSVRLPIGETVSCRQCGTDVRPIDTLTPRELKLIDLLTQGLSNRDIGKFLGIREHSISVALGKIFDKTGFENRVQLAVWRVRQLVPSKQDSPSA